LLLRPPEAAALLGISRSKLYDLLKAGDLRSVTIDAARRIPFADLVDYVEGLRHPNHPRRPQVEQSAVPMPTAPSNPTKRATTQKPSRQTGTEPLQLRFEDLAASGPP
jgi:excisionase family DNA binding protein